MKSLKRLLKVHLYLFYILQRKAWQLCFQSKHISQFLPCLSRKQYFFLEKKHGDICDIYVTYMTIHDPPDPKTITITVIIVVVNCYLQAGLEVHQFWPLVKIECSPDLRFFLCRCLILLNPTQSCSILTNPTQYCQILLNPAKSCSIQSSPSDNIESSYHMLLLPFDDLPLQHVHPDLHPYLCAAPAGLSKCLRASQVSDPFSSIVFHNVFKRPTLNFS